MAEFHYAGPFHDGKGREPIHFPWEKLNAKPLVYASLGTLVNGLEYIYQTILETARRLSEIQGVLSIGQNVRTAAIGTIPSNVIAVGNAPQIALLKRAALCITHAGLNTALECLAHGVPMVAIPIAYDQPGIAVRIAHHGVGEFLDIEDVTANSLRGLVDQVLNNGQYREKARWFQNVIARTRGLDVAADVIERAFDKVPRDATRTVLSHVHAAYSRKVRSTPSSDSHPKVKEINLPLGHSQKLTASVRTAQCRNKK